MAGRGHDARSVEGVRYARIEEAVHNARSAVEVASMPACHRRVAVDAHAAGQAALKMQRLWWKLNAPGHQEALSSCNDYSGGIACSVAAEGIYATCEHGKQRSRCNDYGGN